MGIDDVHRAFRPKAPIRLECQKCEHPNPNVVRRYGAWFIDAGYDVLCDACSVAIRTAWLDDQYRKNFPIHSR